MSRILALEWDDYELRYLLASNGKNRPKLIAAGSCALESIINKNIDEKPEDVEGEVQENEGEDSQQTNDDQFDISEIIKTALGGEKISKVTTLINVKRSNVEFLQLELPPGNDQELPGMVRNQAMLESPSITEESIIDFQAIGNDPSVPRDVIAVSIPEADVIQIQSSLVLAGLNSKRFCLRAFSTASLSKRLVEDLPETAIVVNCVNREVDLLQLQSGKLSQMRNIRLTNTSEDEKNHAQILRELRRMIMLSPKFSSEDEDSGSIYLYGNPEECEGLQNLLEKELDLSIHLIDPFSRMKSKPEQIPENSGSYASLISLVMEEAREEKPSIDFLNPKKPPKPPNKQRQYMIYSAVAVVILASGFFLYSETVGQLNSDISSLDSRYKKQRKQTKTISAQKKTMAAILAWDKGNINWLDELRDLSIRFPSAQDIQFDGITLSSSNIKLNGLARSRSVIDLMEQNIRDDYHKIETRQVKEQLKDKAYTWHFNTTLSIRKRKKEQYISHIPEHLRPVLEEKKTDKTKSKKSKSKSGSKTTKSVSKNNTTSKKKTDSSAVKSKKTATQ